MKITTILVDCSSHLSSVTMKYNRIELVNVKMNTKMRAAMLSIMILSTSTDRGWKQVGEAAFGELSSRQETLKKEFGSEFSLLTSMSTSCASFLSLLFWFWGCLGWDSSTSPSSILYILISSLVFLSVCLDLVEFLASIWITLAGGGGGRFTLGCISLSSLSCSLNAKIETVMTARSARSEGMKISDISAARPCRYSAHRTKRGSARQESRSSDNMAARITGMISTSLEEITAF